MNVVRWDSTQNKYDLCYHNGGEERIRYQNLEFLSFNILSPLVRLLFFAGFRFQAVKSREASPLSGILLIEELVIFSV